MNYIDKIKEEFEGREIYICDISGTDGKRINFDQGNVSLCHDTLLGNPRRCDLLLPGIRLDRRPIMSAFMI